MKSALLATLLFFATLSYPAHAEDSGFGVHLSAGGGVGYTKSLNDRLMDDVSSSAIALRGAMEATFSGLLPQGGVRMAFTLHDSLFPGTANVLGGNLLLQYVDMFTVSGRSFTWGVGAGPEFFIAPTQDAGTTWYGYSVKADVRTSLFGLDCGLYLTFEQIIMDGVEDPLFVTIGVEVFYSLYGRRPVAAPVPKKVRTSSPSEPTAVAAVNPQDPDGDGVGTLKDRCPNTKKGRRVDETGCRPIADGMVFDELTFLKGKATFDKGAAMELNRVAELLKANSTIIVVVVVQAPGALLAKKRADIIEMELMQRKIPKERITLSPQVGVSESISLNFRLGL